MRHLGTGLALVAAMTFSSIAFAQTRGSALIRGPINESAVPPDAAAKPDSAPSCQSTICGSITRYTQTLVVEATEYTYNPNGSCNFEDAGQWTAPTDIMPMLNGKPAGTVNVSAASLPGPTPINPYTGVTCTGGGTYMYAPLYFTWTLRANSTAVLGYGPTASFSSTWSGQFGSFFDETFEISVPVVHPRGEVSSGLAAVTGGTFAVIGVFQQTLKPQAGEQPGFDFAGDCVKEQLWYVGPHTCSGSNLPGSIWEIQPGSHYVDDVGLLLTQSVMIPCSDTVAQNMYFKSQAEQHYSPNPYTSSLNRHVILLAQTSNPNVIHFSASRNTALGMASTATNVDLTNAPGLTKNLPNFPASSPFCSKQ